MYINLYFDESPDIQLSVYIDGSCDCAGKCKVIDHPYVLERPIAYLIQRIADKNGVFFDETARLLPYRINLNMSPYRGYLLQFKNGNISINVRNLINAWPSFIPSDIPTVNVNEATLAFLTCALSRYLGENKAMKPANLPITSHSYDPHPETIQDFLKRNFDRELFDGVLRTYSEHKTWR